MPYRQGFAWWAFAGDERADATLLDAAARIGYRSVDFLPEELWRRARDAGLQLATIDGHIPLEVGFNDPSQHRQLTDQVRRSIGKAHVAGARFVAVASGNRSSSLGDGIAACAEGLTPLAGEAWSAGVVLLMEPLNSKVDHVGHECDRTEWSAALIDRVASPGLRILYYFYHAQIMEGDLLRTVEMNWDRIAHFHTAGVPGRHELDDAQEINWRAVVRHLVRRGYDGDVIHEFIPVRDPLTALSQAFAALNPAAAANNPA